MSERDKLTLARVSWLQSLVSHRIVPSSFAKHLYQRCCSIAHTPYDESAYRAMLDETSKQFSVLDLELRTVRDQSSGKDVLALVNTKDDPLVRGATSYSALEISFIRKLIEEIVRARREAYAIPSLEAVRLGSKLGRSHMTRDATEELLRNLVDHKWIDYSSEGIYTLSTRSLLELRNYLQNEFGEEHYHTCSHCKDLVTLGLACSYTSRGCTVRYHLHCARSTIGSRANDDDALYRLAGFNCPGCSRSWKSRPIGPKALQLSAGRDGETPFSSQVEQSQEVTRRRRQESESEEEEEEFHDTQQGLAAQESDEEDVEVETARRSGRVKPEPEQSQLQQQRGRRPRVQESDEEGEDSESEQDVKPRKRAR